MARARPMPFARLPASLGHEDEEATGARPIDQETTTVQRRQFLQTTATSTLMFSSGLLRAGADDRRAP
jgi:hypothetical protein